MFDELAIVDPAADEEALIARITALEIAKSAAAAGQARATAALDAARRAAQEAAGVPAAKRGRGLGSEVGLARHDSPNRGNKHLVFAKILVHDMPHTMAALSAGVLSEWRAALIVREASALTVADRRRLDEQLCANQRALAGQGNRRIATAARSIAYRLDPQAVTDRAARAPGERGVALRPAPDAMAYLTALLPIAQATAVHAALTTAADSCADGRAQGHVMADTLVERITGRPADVPVPVAVNLVITDDTLLAGDTEPARVPGYGPIPAAIARHLIGGAVFDDHSIATLRRLYAHPTSGALVAMESKARAFPKGLARFIALRDDTCRTPYCDAPIRHIDHADPHIRGGPTNAVNGNGTCAACNYTKEAPGWQVHTWDADDGVHVADVTTPTGAHHRSSAPPLPGAPGADPSGHVQPDAA